MPSNEKRCLLVDVILPGDTDRKDILIEGERIAGIEPAGVVPDTDMAVVWQGRGGLALPGLVEPHVHLDKTYSHEVYLEQGTSGRGALSDAIDAMARYKRERSLDDVVSRARRAAYRAAARGVSYLRSHIDLGTDADLEVVRALLDLRREVAGSIRLEFTALTSTRGAADRERLRAALKLGVHAVGGAPALEDDPCGSIDRALDIALEEGCALDLHIDENEDPDSPCLAHLARQCSEREVDITVTAAHCCALAFMPAARRAEQIEAAVAAGIRFITLPACNLVLMGRDQWPRPRGNPPVAELLGAGATVAVGTDNVQDPFQPWGDYDPLQQAALLGHVQHWDGSESGTLIDMCTSAAARAMGLQHHGLEVGCRANLVVLDTPTEHAALCETPVRTLVLHRGEPLSPTPADGAPG